MIMLRDREVLAAIRKIHQQEKGNAVSDADRAYKRGWRDGLNHLRSEIKEIIAGRRQAT